MFEHDFGRRSGYNQIAPGRDVAPVRPVGQPGRPRQNPIQEAIGAPPMQAPQLGANPMQQAIQPFAPQTPVDPRPETTPISPVETNWDRLNGNFNRNKLQDPNKQSAKYIMGRTLAGFDPRQGITSDVLNALNGLGFGTFSSAKGRDKLSLSGLTQKGRDHGLVGDYNDADFIEAFSGGNGLWTYQDPAEEARRGITGGVNPAMAPRGVNSLLPAILGTVPGAQEGQSYADQLRQQIMQALQVSPELAALSQKFM